MCPIVRTAITSIPDSFRERVSIVGTAITTIPDILRGRVSIVGTGITTIPDILWGVYLREGHPIRVPLAGPGPGQSERRSLRFVSCKYEPSYSADQAC